jgi:hypothetical protein
MSQEEVTVRNRTLNLKASPGGVHSMVTSKRDLLSRFSKRAKDLPGSIRGSAALKIITSPDPAAQQNHKRVKSTLKGMQTVIRVEEVWRV